MIGLRDLPALGATLLVAGLVALLTVLLLRMLTKNRTVLISMGGLTFPALVVVGASAIEVTNPDPHGWVLPFLLLLAAIVAPFTVFVSYVAVGVLARRFPSR